MLLLLWCWAFAWALKDSSLSLVTRARSEACLRLLNRRVSLLCALLSVKRPNSQPGGTLSCYRPGCGSSAGCISLRLLGEGGTPPAPGGLGRLRRQPPLGPGRTPTTARRRPPAAKTRTGRRARSVHAARLPHAYATRTRRVLRAHAARLPARRTARLTARRAARLPARRTARFTARRTARLPARRAACFPAREQRVYRRAN